MNKIRYYLVMGAFALMAVAIFMGIVRTLRGPGEAKITIGIQAIDGYGAELEAAMDVWNGFVGCRFLIPGDNTTVKSQDGQPCGIMMREQHEYDHAATAYRCEDGTFEILVSTPGNTNTQAAVIAHEIGHRLKDWGVRHASIGVMSNPKDPNNGEQNVLRIRDQDVKAIKEFFCHE